ncbi:MAG TPA: Crp/Fnr family transcriptional regulator [Rhodospirillaceae bacterium]|nr:Crp/Fnr family transcriptional regulator [Rhodospirillaceae bacterium]
MNRMRSTAVARAGANRPTSFREKARPMPNVGQDDRVPESGRYLLNILDADTKREAVQRAATRRYANREMLIRQGEKANGIHIITGGTVESLFESAGGRELILGTWQAGDFVGGPYVFGDHEHMWGARALGTVTTLYLNHDSLKAFAQQSAPFALALIESLGFKGQRYSKLAQTLATHTTTERLALLISELADNAAPSSDGKKRVGMVRQSKLAHMIGATRQSVANALQKLEDSGAIALEPTSFIIADRAILGELAGSND